MFCKSCLDAQKVRISFDVARALKFDWSKPKWTTNFGKWFDLYPCYADW
jgi:hypothetical protein